MIYIEDLDKGHDFFFGGGGGGVKHALCLA